MRPWPGNADKEQTAFGGLRRGQLMARIRSTGNKTTEQRLALLLRRQRLVGWRRHLDMPGRPDFVWPKDRLSVFVDGCFWHGHRCGRNVTPKTNAAAWRDKIRKNRNRDRKATRLLRRREWTVVRMWECVLTEHPERCLQAIRKALASSSGR